MWLFLNIVVLAIILSIPIGVQTVGLWSLDVNFVFSLFLSALVFIFCLCIWRTIAQRAGESWPKKVVLGGATVLLSTAILFIIPFGYISMVAPSINEIPAFKTCGKDNLIQGKYVTFEKVPPTLMKVLKVAEPGYKTAAARHMNFALEMREDAFKGQIREALFEIWIRRYSDSAIVTYYLNRTYFGSGCYGIDAAAKEYFKKDVASLDIQELAEILAIPKAPSVYSPISHPDENKKRAQEIIEKIDKDAQHI